MTKKTNWNKIRPAVWSIKYYKEDDKGNTKFYETSDDFDHSHFAEYVDNEDLVEIKTKERKI
jgi:hypothetical protein